MFYYLGSPHVHGVLFLDIPRIVKAELEKGNQIFKHLEEAFAACAESRVPDNNETSAIEAFVDKFMTCSLRNPSTRKIATTVQRHHHTFTCRKRSSKCRFNFPRFPSLYTQVAIPLRLRFGENDEEGKRKEMMKTRIVLHKVREILEDEERMDEVNKLFHEEIEEIFNANDLSLRAKHILEDKVFEKQILDFSTYFNGEETKDNPCLGKDLIQNLKLFEKEHAQNYKLLEKEDFSYRKQRLLQILRMADIENDLDIADDLNFEEKEKQLIVKYHEILRNSVKGFTIILQRDTNECYINNFNHEWLACWNANIDVSVVFDFFAILTYVR